MPSISDILIAFSLFSFTVLAGALFAPAPSAYAATAYDNVIATTDSVIVTNTENQQTLDLTLDWYSETQDALGLRCLYTGGVFCTMAQKFNDILLTPDADWIVFNDGTMVTILFSLDTINCTFAMFDSSTPAMSCKASSNEITAIQLISNGACSHNWRTENCTFISNQYADFPLSADVWYSYQTIGSFDLTFQQIFIANATVVYPPNYDGIVIPDSYDPPVTRTEVPQWRILSLINFEARIIDSAFNTFDPNVWTCEEDLTPIIHYTLTGGGETKSGIFSPTVPLNLQLPEIYEQTDYVLTGYYECPDSTTFSETSTIEFQVDLNGNQSFNFFEDCFVETFPFIQFNECISNLRHVVQLMGFNLAIFGEDWVMPNTDCYALTDLHEWLGLSNNVVCKQFPSYVRTTITPFISFAIGLMALKFLASRRRDDM